ncbi:MAG: diguanylate cyclase, partial [Candidatus Competibacteraceae bacterium]|nr:diguanylate cyclase [Candidatus Competibacteraceae bacterium]
DLTAACSIAENIRQAIEQLDINQEQDTHQEQNGLHVTVSIGVSSFSPQLASIENLLQRADENLYQAKSRGKNQVVS